MSCASSPCVTLETHLEAITTVINQQPKELQLFKFKRRIFVLEKLKFTSTSLQWTQNGTTHFALYPSFIHVPSIFQSLNQHKSRFSTQHLYDLEWSCSHTAIESLVSGAFYSFTNDGPSLENIVVQQTKYMNLKLKQQRAKIPIVKMAHDITHQAMLARLWALYW